MQKESGGNSWGSLSCLGRLVFFFPVRLLVSPDSSLSCRHFPEMFNDSPVTLPVSEGGVRCDQEPPVCVDLRG